MDEKLEALSPESQTGQDPDIEQGEQSDVQTDPSTDEGYLSDGQAGDDGQGDDIDVDDRGVPWKNKAMELQRKLSALETRHGATAGQGDNLPPKEPALPPADAGAGEKAAVDTQTPEIPDTAAEFVEYAKVEAAKAATKAANEAYRQQEIQRDLIAKYPDIKNPATPLHQWTAHFLNKRYDGNPNFLEEAVMRAAQELDVQPASGNSQNSQQQQRPLSRNQGPLPSTEKGVTTSSAKGDTSILTPLEIQTAKRLGQDLKKLAAFKRREFL